MPKTYEWQTVRESLGVDEALVTRERLRLRLAILREQLGKSQVELAEILGTSQPNVSQLERSEDLQLSSLARYVHVLGGQLQINVVVGDATYRLVDDVEENAQMKSLPDLR